MTTTYDTHEEMQLDDLIQAARDILGTLDDDAIPLGKLYEILGRVNIGQGRTALDLFSASVGIVASMAALTGDPGIHLYNEKSNVWVHITVDSSPPEGVNGEMITLSGDLVGSLKDGTFVRDDGVTPAQPVKGCRICGQEGCTDGTCKQRRDMLQAVRNMGRVGPQEGLRDVDAKDDGDE